MSGGHAFISYVRDDIDEVDRMEAAFRASGIPIWRDTAELWPGDDWRSKIKQAIAEDALVVIACFSNKGAARTASYQNEELNLAIEQMRLRRPNVPWLIPVRFDECDIPDLAIGGGRTLRSIHWANLFGVHYAKDITRLVEAVRRLFSERPSMAEDATAKTASALESARD